MPVEFQVQVFAPTINPLLQLQILGDLVVLSRLWALEVRSEARKYPKERPGQTYKRTYRLKNNWKIDGPTLVGVDLVTTVTNSTSYAAKVHGRDDGTGQAWFHQGRWAKILAIVTSVMPLQLRAQAAINARMRNAFVTETIRIT